ncbi:ABC-three component system middle component 4 [Stenotrophomonas sp. CFBP8994]|uniref:ABC-three component system middle component 4 n=1 Tax=Stenotrophomonas sp. CFBP8994 TaxID=3096527 RepID=UPI002A6B0B7A|nr:ABC-three component system middle component 4 [Stenotrophomonas sp. CFBP8994]
MIAELDDSPSLNEARILILIAAFQNDEEGSSVEGITKLAKLDFLLRYPVMLEKALLSKGRSIRDLQLQEHERYSVESEMVRYRFGPWDHRYKEYLNVLTSKGLVAISIEGRKVVISVTKDGKRVAQMLASNKDLEILSQRANILKRNFDLTATNLMKFIYETFPEIISLRSNVAIPT